MLTEGIKPLLRRLRNALFRVRHRRLIRGSRYFDPDWYLSQNPGLQSDPLALRDPARHYLRHGWDGSLRPGPDFDPVWYLREYPEVATSRLNPLVHFEISGRHIGLLPLPDRALAYDFHLWRGLAPIMLPRLEQLMRGLRPAVSLQEPVTAAWAVARWRAFHGDWGGVSEILMDLVFGGDAFSTSLGPHLLLFSALLHAHRSREALTLLGQLDRRFPEARERFLARAAWNVVFDPSDRRTSVLEALNAMYQTEGLEPVAIASGHVPGLDSLCSERPEQRCDGEGCVSVIVPAFNCIETLPAALASLWSQTWSDLELVVVDDCSSDGTGDWIEAWRSEVGKPTGRKVVVVRHTENLGAYHARNTGLQHTTGRWVTVHDSDDWSHPRKIEEQVRVLQSTTHAKASMSHWVRTTPDLVFQNWRIEARQCGWVVRNISSLLLERSVMNQLGFWDEVKVAADSELVARIIAVWGEGAVVDACPGVPLSFGRVTADSLTQSGETGQETEFFGVRKEYTDFYRRWHVKSRGRVENLHLSKNPAKRSFPAPPALLSRDISSANCSDADRIQLSGLFDSAWYVSCQPELQEQKVDALEHFLTLGLRAGRDPGPEFSRSGYALAYSQRIPRRVEPILHYLESDSSQGTSGLPYIEGRRQSVSGRPTVCIVGHAAGPEPGGAERCLLDNLDALERIGWNAVVVLPNALDIDYVEKVRARASGVAFIPFAWWLENRPPCRETVGHFKVLMSRHDVKLVHANTVVLDEPYLAAQELGKPLLIHVHELPEHDRELCARLDTTPERLRERIWSLASGLIVNSRTTQQYWSGPPSGTPPTYLLPNQFPMERLLALPLPLANRRSRRLAMISSNQAKKGVADFVEVARRLTDRLPKMEFVLYGPETALLRTLGVPRRRVGRRGGIRYGGYVEDPSDALRETDILLNLSHVEESFGRTALEAMAAGRPVICYARGALPELVSDGANGYLVPFRDLDRLAERIDALVRQGDRIREMGRCGRERARAHAKLGFDAVIAGIYREFLMQAERSASGERVEMP